MQFLTLALITVVLPRFPHDSWGKPVDARTFDGAGFSVVQLSNYSECVYVCISSFN